MQILKRIEIIIEMLMTGIMLIEILLYLFYKEYIITENTIKFLSIQLLIVFTCILLINLYKYGLISLNIIFICTFCLFNLSRIFISVFSSEYNFYQIRSMVTTDLSYLTQTKLICIYTMFLIIYQITINLIGYQSKKVRQKDKLMNLFILQKNKIKRDSYIILIGKTLILVTLPICFFRYLSEYNVISAFGYTSLYTGALNKLNQNIILKVAPSIFSIGYYSLITGCPSKKEFNRYSVMFMFIKTLDSLKGVRIGLMVTIIFFVWYKKKIYNVNFSAKKIMIYLFIIIIFLQLISYIRSDIEINKSIMQLFFEFFYYQGQSMIVPALYIENQEVISYNSYPYIFEPMIYIFLSFKYPYILNTGQSEEILKVRYNLSHHLTYALNPGYYLSGSNMGDNMVAEFWEFGITGIIVGAMLSALMVSKIEKYIFNKRVYAFLSYPVITHIIIMPRSGFLINSYNIFKILVGYVLITIVINLIKNINQGFSKKELIH